MPTNDKSVCPNQPNVLKTWKNGGFEAPDTITKRCVELRFGKHCTTEDRDQIDLNFVAELLSEQGNSPTVMPAISKITSPHPRSQDKTYNVPHATRFYFNTEKDRDTVFDNYQLTMMPCEQYAVNVMTDGSDRQYLYVDNANTGEVELVTAYLSPGAFTLVCPDVETANYATRKMGKVGRAPTQWAPPYHSTRDDNPRADGRDDNDPFHSPPPNDRSSASKYQRRDDYRGDRDY